MNFITRRRYKAKNNSWHRRYLFVSSTVEEIQLTERTNPLQQLNSIVGCRGSFLYQKRISSVEEEHQPKRRKSSYKQKIFTFDKENHLL
jgi:hypothetical protein